jgi:predicted dinucleotide-binding enzyme
MRVGILGSGLMGGKLGTIFARAGHEVVTCCLAMDASNTKLIVGTTTSGAEELAKKVARAHVVCAFNTVPSEVLLGVCEAKRKNARPSLVYCGDDKSAKDVAARLVDDAGFDSVDVSPLRIARYTEPFGLLVGELAYNGEGGPELAYDSSGLKTYLDFVGGGYSWSA